MQMADKQNERFCFLFTLDFYKLIIFIMMCAFACVDKIQSAAEMVLIFYLGLYDKLLTYSYV